MLAALDTETVIVPDEEHNSKPENRDSQNIYISGDNLDGLKHLLKSYAGQVKCIYIDPPYNTGSDGFAYNDSFEFTVETLMEKLSVDEGQAVVQYVAADAVVLAVGEAVILIVAVRHHRAHGHLQKPGGMAVGVHAQGGLGLAVDDLHRHDQVFVARAIVVIGFGMRRAQPKRQRERQHQREQAKLLHGIVLLRRVFMALL